MHNEGPDAFHSGKEGSWLESKKQRQDGRPVATYPAACSEAVLHLPMTVLSPSLLYVTPETYFELCHVPVPEH